MQIVPVQPLPSQTLQAQLGLQPCTINVYQQLYGLFVDVFVGDALIIAGVIAENLNRIVRSRYLGFDGDLVFLDTQSADFGTAGADPVYTALGSRYVLIYLDAADLEAADLP